MQGKELTSTSSVSHNTPRATTQSHNTARVDSTPRTSAAPRKTTAGRTTRSKRKMVEDDEDETEVGEMTDDPDGEYGEPKTKRTRASKRKATDKHIKAEDNNDESLIETGADMAEASTKPSITRSGSSRVTHVEDDSSDKAVSGDEMVGAGAPFLKYDNEVFDNGSDDEDPADGDSDDGDDEEDLDGDDYEEHLGDEVQEEDLGGEVHDESRVVSGENSMAASLEGTPGKHPRSHLHKSRTDFTKSGMQLSNVLPGSQQVGGAHGTQMFQQHDTMRFGDGGFGYGNMHAQSHVPSPVFFGQHDQGHGSYGYGGYEQPPSRMTTPFAAHGSYGGGYGNQANSRMGSNDNGMNMSAGGFGMSSGYFGQDAARMGLNGGMSTMPGLSDMYGGFGGVSDNGSFGKPGRADSGSTLMSRVGSSISSDNGVNGNGGYAPLSSAFSSDHVQGHAMLPSQHGGMNMSTPSFFMSQAQHENPAVTSDETMVAPDTLPPSMFDAENLLHGGYDQQSFGPAEFDDENGGHGSLGGDEIW